jgi:hypothetical protein
MEQSLEDLPTPNESLNGILRRTLSTRRLGHAPIATINSKASTSIPIAATKSAVNCTAGAMTMCQMGLSAEVFLKKFYLKRKTFNSKKWQILSVSKFLRV